MNAKIPAIFNVVALALLVAVVNISGLSIHIGLFYTAGSYKNTVIVLIEFLIEVIIGVIFCILATIFIWVYTYSEKSHKLLFPPIIMNLLSGILTWVAVGRFLQVVILFNKYSGYLGVSYSLILSGLGGLLCFVTMIIIGIKKNKDRKEQIVSQEGGVAISAARHTRYNLGYGEAS